VPTCQVEGVRRARRRGNASSRANSFAMTALVRCVSRRAQKRTAMLMARHARRISPATVFDIVRASLLVRVTLPAVLLVIGATTRTLPVRATTQSACYPHISATAPCSGRTGSRYVPLPTGARLPRMAPVSQSWHSPSCAPCRGGAAPSHCTNRYTTLHGHMPPVPALRGVAPERICHAMPHSFVRYPRVECTTVHCDRCRYLHIGAGMLAQVAPGTRQH
jgi:hypothetical protein